MRTLVIENVEDDLHLKIQEQARSNSRSMEEEVHLLLHKGVSAPLPGSATYNPIRQITPTPYDALHAHQSKSDEPWARQQFVAAQWDPLG